MNKQLQIRPYARLLTMLGEQLIKNERIALIELIKNAYDADAEWVKISFVNFGRNYKVSPSSLIVVEDSGHGMTRDVIEDHWLNPATPVKKRKKNANDLRTKGKNRVIQGDKGIGRFAILKLGRKVTIITRAEGEDEEHVVEYDFSQYDDEFLKKEGEEKDIFLDELTVEVTSRPPQCISNDTTIRLGVEKRAREAHGVRIEIRSLKGTWTERKVRDVYSDVGRLQPIFTDLQSREKKDTFNILFYKDEKRQNFQENYKEKLQKLLDEQAVLKVEEGSFDAKKMQYRFKMNGTPRVLNLSDPDVKGLTVYKRRFEEVADENVEAEEVETLEERVVKVGPFDFGFYIFDFSSKAPPKHQLDSEDKKILRDHRIYLYRDGLRVYPYGEPEDDWLNVDVFRGTISASLFPSNDQMVGYVNISGAENPLLRDKTNREGLLDEGNTTQDFVTLIQVILGHIRGKDYQQYRIDLQKKAEQDRVKEKRVESDFDELKEAVADDKKVLKMVNQLQDSYEKEQTYLTRRAELTEELAGVGLSVETASHDIMKIMSRVLENIDGLITDLMRAEQVDKGTVVERLQSVRGGVSFVEDQLKDIQLIFTPSKKRRRNLRVEEIVEKVARIYERTLEKNRIELKIAKVPGSPLVIKATDAVLLQLLLNLFDNSVYWLQQTSREDKKMNILLDGKAMQMIFSDNGPGISKRDEEYVFEPFYSGKGDEGRGLGLYIARQLLARIDYSIRLADIKVEKRLEGANFVVDFAPEE